MSGIKPLPVWRRISIALLSLAIAVPLFHVEVAAALVTRGDEFLSRGDLASARRYYGRALVLDRNSQDAADRFVFFSSSALDKRVLLGAVRAATNYLTGHPANAQLLADRALCFERLKQYRLAARDFSSAARVSGSARDFTFAGWAALRAGQRGDALRFWRYALARDARFGPARLALQRIRP